MAVPPVTAMVCEFAPTATITGLAAVMAMAGAATAPTFTGSDSTAFRLSYTTTVVAPDATPVMVTTFGCAGSSSAAVAMPALLLVTP